VPWPGSRSLDTFLFFWREELERRDGDAGADTPPLRLKLDGRICGCRDLVKEGEAFWSSEPRRLGRISGCLACIVMLPSRPASTRLKATLEIWRFWSWSLWTTVRACEPPG